MARREQQPLVVVFANSASATIREIWRWNAKEKGESHADDYVAFLQSQLKKLATHPALGEAVSEFNGIRRLLMQRRASRYGHIAIYRVVDKTVQILLIYHTAQDWQSHLLDDLE